MTHIFNEELAKSWKSLLVDREFTYKEKSYVYNVGQPMGAYSSWAVFTLSHHLIVH
jgi:hypothetical protein